MLIWLLFLQLKLRLALSFADMHCHGALESFKYSKQLCDALLDRIWGTENISQHHTNSWEE
jgi:hypothetical protein